MTNNINEYIMFIFIFLLTTTGLLLSGNRSMFANANRVYNHPGETIPITVEEAIGKDFNITCYMNPKTFPGINSTCLHFVIGRTNKELPRENIVTVNSTTIIYMVHNASEQQTEYRCKCGPDAIMETKVFVGSRPRPVKEFLCRSYDFDHMICNFTKPANPILTTYNVSYYNEYPSYIYQPRCNYDDRNLVICNTSLSERYQEMYHFIIESRNALVKANEQPLIQRFDINNFEIMIPKKPGDKMRVESITVDSIKLSWQMATWEKYRFKGLQWEVLLQPENSTVVQREAPVREHNELRLRLNNLPYANWNYKLMIRVHVRHPSAIWSEQFVYQFRTAARRPLRPPRVQPGSFYIDTTETRITVYWEELLPQEYNGENFTYVITALQPDGKLSDLKPRHQEKNLAKFSWQKDLYYEFEIRSKNHLGESLEASRLIIYPTNQRNQKEYTPLDIHNVYHGNNRTYTLTWRNPKKTEGLLSFTVYWCYTKRSLQTECKESMHFQNVPAGQLNFTTQPQNDSDERVLNLAVSANYDKFNTGLHWTDCSMDIVNIDLVKMDPELVGLANSIKVQWSVERVCPSILDGFNITYCEVANDATEENATCLHQPINVTAQKYYKKYFIKDLKTYTKYKITMFMYWRTKKGKSSDPQVVQTLEGAPSPPRQLRVESITNNSAVIKWSEPTYPNGKINKYIIMLNNEQHEVNASTCTYQLENLESFTAYKVYVMAETVERSETSNDVHFVTAIGTPSPPVIGPNDNKKNIMLWNKPDKPSGSIDFYEVRVTERYNDKERRRISIIMGASTCTFEKFPNCKGAEYKTTVDVRAVNAAPLADKTTTLAYSYQSHMDDDDIYKNNDDLECMGTHTNSTEYTKKIQQYMNRTLYELYRSQWQTTVIHSCSLSPMSRITTVALIVIAMSLGVMAALYMARKKYNKMSNINCTLPPGLDPYFTKEAGAGFPGNFGGGTHTINDTRAMEDQWISAARMHDFNFRNEHHHLLASLGNDSGYLGGGGGVNNSGDALNEHILGSSLETADMSEGNIPGDVDQEDFEKEHLKESLNSASISADSLVESSEGSECNNGDLEHSPLTIFPNNNGYIKQSMLQPWQTFNNHEDEEQDVRDSIQIPTIPAATNGYITVQNLSNALAKPTSNQHDLVPPSTAGGYVLQQDLQNFFNKSSTTQPLASTAAAENVSQFNCSGYTTLESLTKLNLPTSLPPPPQNANQPQPDISNTNPPPLPIEAHGDAGGAHDDVAKPGVISGYVTQQDLNIFAQHQHI